MVDRNQQEKFVFVDCTGEEQGGGPRRDLVVTLCYRGKLSASSNSENDVTLR